jgi:hypothetical protein
MTKRLLSCSPQQMLSLDRAELLDGIRISEGRTVEALCRMRGPNMVQYVNNAEVAASLGADIIHLEAYHPQNPMFPGLPSKDPEDDEVTRMVEVPLGRGWTLREVRALIGRPVSCVLTVPPGYGASMVDSALGDIRDDVAAGVTLYTPEKAELLLEQGTDIICVEGWAEPEVVLSFVSAAKRLIGDRCVLASGVRHGPGLVWGSDAPRDLRELITPDYCIALADAGADIIQFPAVGCTPGFDMAYASSLVDAIHRSGCLAAAGIHSSVEGTDSETIKRIGVDNKICGADIQVLGDGGLHETMGMPETLMALCIAIKGRRHTYRRMAESVLR